jgi:hypothetical protein
MKQEAPQPRPNRAGIPTMHGGEHVKSGALDRMDG